MLAATQRGRTNIIPAAQIDGIENSMTAADWAACAITFGWAATAFWVVHVITRRPTEGTAESAKR